MNRVLHVRRLNRVVFVLIEGAARDPGMPASRPAHRAFAEQRAAQPELAKAAEHAILLQPRPRPACGDDHLADEPAPERAEIAAPRLEPLGKRPPLRRHRVVERAAFAILADERARLRTARRLARSR